ncbi:hypothetical protein ACSAZL_02950 [Methanosarcina sp. T3]|uniref:hypothetical protein n=1 Tax=Methanosarcina sp. T3 TaxID=3439062 RepID=UPI003F82C014
MKTELAGGYGEKKSVTINLRPRENINVHGLWKTFPVNRNNIWGEKANVHLESLKT